MLFYKDLKTFSGLGFQPTELAFSYPCFFPSLFFII